MHIEFISSIGKRYCIQIILVGCVIHHNLSPVSGHYTSYIWDRRQSVWFHTNDEKVSYHITTTNIYVLMLLHMLFQR